VKGSKYCTQLELLGFTLFLLVRLLVTAIISSDVLNNLCIYRLPDGSGPFWVMCCLLCKFLLSLSMSRKVSI
jgi:hypothetical protein